MSMPPLRPPRPTIVYPDSDGERMADNTAQFEWIVTIKGGLEGQYANDENVFVAGDLLWYPVEGNNKICTAPDVMVAFGRPRGYRGSYLQWREGGIAPQVVFEMHSPSNRKVDLLRRFLFYEHYGVEEYYHYDPDLNDLSGWIRSGGKLCEIPQINGWKSPRLGIQFVLTDDDMHIIGADGKRFVTFNELHGQRDQAVLEHERAEQQVALERERAEKLAAQLRALGVEPEA
jgi:Uma2 family endonuclease